jgi:hypothetical protein
MKNEAASALASMRWAKSTKKERVACGRNAALARWKNHKKAVKPAKTKKIKKVD